jgi:hypothetical protein
MRPTKARASSFDCCAGLTAPVRLAELNTLITATSIHIHATLDAQHETVAAEIAALQARVRRLQAYANGIKQTPMPAGERSSERSSPDAHQFTSGGPRSGP